MKTNLDLGKLCSDTLNSILIWIPIPQNFNNSFSDKISAIYVYDTINANDYLIGIEHNDIYKHDIVEVCRLFKIHKKIIFNSNIFIEHSMENKIDMELMNWIISGDAMKTNFTEISRKNYKIYDNMRHIKTINNFVPIMPFVDSCREIRNEALIDAINIKELHGFNFYNDIVLRELGIIEKNGICVDVNNFKKYFNVDTEKIRYSKYNIYTRTGRPSNIDSIVNFSALNKSTGVRSIIISRFEKGKLVEFDYESHHFRLLGQLLNYKFTCRNIHEYFGKIYFETSELTPEQYEQSKLISFRQLYGETDDEFSELEFFKKIQEYKIELWKKFEIEGYIETPIAKKRILKKHHKKMNLNKLFNYLLQAYETEHNLLVMKEINRILEFKNTKLILYTYDSFLLDFDITEGKNIIAEIKSAIEKNDMFSVIKIGNNFDEMHVTNF